jgi:hypothetical protein
MQQQNNLELMQVACSVRQGTPVLCTQEKQPGDRSLSQLIMNIIPMASTVAGSHWQAWVPGQFSAAAP